MSQENIENKLIEAMTDSACIREMPLSDLGHVTHKSAELFRGFPLGTCWDIISDWVTIPYLSKSLYANLTTI
jgi:hypothetical protein